MNHTRRITLMATLLASSVALAPAAAALGSTAGTAAAPTGGQCSLQKSGGKSDSSARFTLTGSGFNGSKKVTVTSEDGQSRTVGVSKSGNFQAKHLPYGQYSATPGQGSAVKCTSPAKPAGDTGTDTGKAKTPEEQYAAGRKAGFDSTKASCETKPKAPGLTAVDPNFEKGYNDGSAEALKAFCGTGTKPQEPNTSAAQIASVTAAATPISGSVKCDPPTTITFNGTITSTGPGQVIYRWARSDGAIGQPEIVNFDAAGAKSVTDTWSRGPHPAGTVVDGWEKIEILKPNVLMKSNEAAFKLTCS
ncbi:MULTISPECIES: hypothetical protein [unclassified Streptomyces]|uniref:hypothetical protein n=1 Tax=unclassified Streptomyces TaxID=2593676 RepID=UPI003331BFA7